MDCSFNRIYYLLNFSSFHLLIPPHPLISYCPHLFTPWSQSLQVSKSLHLLTSSPPYLNLSKSLHPLISYISSLISILAARFFEPMSFNQRLKKIYTLTRQALRG